MVAGMGLVAGLAASRFLKASSERRYGASGSKGDGDGLIQPGRSAYEPPLRSGAVQGA